MVGHKHTRRGSTQATRSHEGSNAPRTLHRDELGEPSILSQILEKKLVFIETKDIVETTMALQNFKRVRPSPFPVHFLFFRLGPAAA